MQQSVRHDSSLSSGSKSHSFPPCLAGLEISLIVVTVLVPGSLSQGPRHSPTVLFPFLVVQSSVEHYYQLKNEDIMISPLQVSEGAPRCGLYFRVHSSLLPVTE